MKNPRILLEDILKIKHDFEAEGIKLPPGLAGMYGEILAFQKMSEIFKGVGVEVQYDSGQKGADIQLIKNGKSIFIEVKTSRLKEEGYGWLFGAALNVKKCKSKKHPDAMFQHRQRGLIHGDFCYFDFVVFVTLSDDFDAKFYIIPRDFIEENKDLLKNIHPRFLSSTHRIFVSNGEKPKLPPEQHELIQKTEKFIDCWDLIGQLL